ncbi:hypothetical protein SGQ83_11265 [Flavobacterium sp. Fl-318]|uniref:Uncharacterized protein n=1 Tax=Flavobacterium cupriresistens TaxID=2893885 RepID=A0ABU4RET5_9FLAO|nr:MULTISPECIES: hypothetical protein [unclassified Flavobacterium]MDX6189930.1 hypothetical protein [Flavobacterium sp. Fl-318]UFH42755.1 hypothetical protein LNP23_00715 [Flavobacterium sp. F-323]
MFDNDYEVLYQMIKDERLEGNITVREMILKNLGNEALLNSIEINNPTLTILVPELPENSFSAQLWNTENQIPKVAIRLSTTNNIPVINLDGSEEIIKQEYIPAYPIIVIKDNERIVVSNNSVNKGIKTRSVGVFNGVNYKFLDNSFDGVNKSKAELARTVEVSAIDPKIITAYNTYNAVNVDGWQRDYIYYGITPDSQKGPFKYNFQEGIKSFMLQGDLNSAYDKIAEQTGDPYMPGRISANDLSNIGGWADGSFEFKVRILVNAKNGVGSEIIKYFSARVRDLFSFKYLGGPFYFYRRFEGFKKMDLNIPIFNWDLDQYASTIKIDVEEVDLTVTTVLTESRNAEFASNFSVDVSGGYKDYVKVGLKYGTSQKITKTSTVQKTFTEGNDLLGDVIVNFADNVIIGADGANYTTREYSSGLYSIGIEPIRVQ